MRLAMFKHAGSVGVALARNGGFHGLSEADPAYPGSLDTLISSGADLVETAKVLEEAPALDPGSIDWLPPLSRPGKILCIGLNYRDHAAETHIAPPIVPEVFVRLPSCLIGHEAPLVLPSQSYQLDYEGELVAVIGKGGRNIARGDAHGHVAAYSVFNDASVRDVQFRTRQWTLGKNFDGTGAFGPWLTTADELPPGAAGLRIRTRLNGAVMQDASTENLIFDVAALIEHLSSVMTLEPGDLIVTGTPSGVGFARTPPVWLKAGDRVEVEIERIGCLANPVAGSG